jgi:hypothetical protein
MFEVVNPESERRVVEVMIFCGVFSLYGRIRNTTHDLGPHGIINQNYSYEEIESRFSSKCFVFLSQTLKKSKSIPVTGRGGP